MSPAADRPALLGDAVVAAELARTPRWGRAGKAIARTWRFADFRAAMAFVNGVADLAEREGHHPDIAIRYGEVTLALWTHAAGGLTTRDFDLARKLDALSP